MSSTYGKIISKKDLFRFYQQSSEKMEQISSSSCDLVMCSPPFWKLRNYTNNDILGSESTSEEYVQNIVNHLSSEVNRILLPTGSFFIELGDTFLEGNLQNIPHRIAIEFQKRGFIQRNSIVVNRKNPKPSSSKKNLTPTKTQVQTLKHQEKKNFSDIISKSTSKSKRTEA